MNAEVFGDKTVAAGAQLRRVSGGFFSDFTTGLFRLEVKYLEEPEPGYVSHRPCKRPIIAIPSVHAFNVDGVVMPDKPVGGLEMKVPALIKYLLTGFGHKKPSFLSAMRALDSTRESLLPHGKLVLGFLKEARIANLDIIRGGKEQLTTYVNAHRFASRGKQLVRHVIAGENDKPLVCSTSANSDSLNVALDRAGEPYLENAYVADSEVFTIKLPATLFQGEGIVSVPALKSWEAGLVTILHPAKERLVGLIKAFNHLLEALRTHVLIFRESIFEARELLNLVIPGNRLVVVPISGDALVQGCVVEMPTEVKPNGSVLNSLKIRPDAIFEGLFHLPCTETNIAYFESGVKPFRASPSVSPALKSGVLDGGNL
jgi:hypothetical protein